MTNNTNAGTSESTPPAVGPLVGIAEIHALLVRVSKQGVLELTFRDDFPEPAADLAEGDVWFLEDVEAWINEHDEAVVEILRKG